MGSGTSALIFIQFWRVAMARTRRHGQLKLREKDKQNCSDRRVSLTDNQTPRWHGRMGRARVYTQHAMADPPGVTKTRTRSHGYRHKRILRSRGGYRIGGRFIVESKGRKRGQS